MSDTTKLKSIAQKAMDGAKQRGVKDVRVSTYRGRKVEVNYRKGRPEKVQESSRQSLNLYLYIDGKYTTCETNDLREQAIDQFLDSSVAMCQAMTPDPYRTITDPELYEGRQERDMGLFDPAIGAVTPKERHEFAAELERQTKRLAGDNVISVESSYEDDESEIYQIHSNGFEGAKKGTQFWSYVELALQDEGDKKPNGWSVAGARSRQHLISPEEVAKNAAETARARLGAAKVETQKMTMVVENRTVNRVLGRLLAAVSGRALQQKASFLDEKIDQPFGSELLDLVDDPFVPAGFGSRLFDDEGIAAKKMPIFEKGVLKNFYIDTYYGKKLGLPPTTGSRSNILITPGDKSLAELVKATDKGILVRGFIGGNSNTTTGDFSLGVFGTLIEKGQLTRAVAEMNIAGNHNDFWKRLVAVGNDPYPYSSVRTPTFVFEDVQFAGS